MKLIVGLGNPEIKYKNTFHNLGFSVADKISELLKIDFNKEKCKARIAETKVRGEKIIIAKPLTYMNLSGESVLELLSFYKISPNNLYVAYDDYDLPKGTVRIRENGSAGTHNGMRSIVANIGENFPRVRIGFKPDNNNRIPLIDLVLSGIQDNDKEIFNNAITIASKSAIDFIEGKPIQEIMQKYNGKANKF